MIRGVPESSTLSTACWHAFHSSAFSAWRGLAPLERARDHGQVSATGHEPDHSDVLDAGPDGSIVMDPVLVLAVIVRAAAGLRETLT